MALRSWFSRHFGAALRKKNERELRLAYFGLVFADFYRLPKDAREQIRAELPVSLKTLLERVESSGEVPEGDDQQGEDAEDHIDWSEIATFEDQVLQRQDEATVRRSAWMVRARYARLVGAERYHAYLASGPPDEKDMQVPLEVVRSDLRRLLGLTHGSYSLAMVRESSRRRVMRRVLYWTLVLCVGTLLIAGWALEFNNYSLAGTICATVLFGCLGAYISVQRRIQESNDGGDPVIGILGLREFNSIQPFPLIAGGVFAIVLYFVIAAKFMTGELFPSIGADGVPAATTLGIDGTTQTASGLVNWAKLFIWSLLAGFAERLVPDTLDRLTNQAKLRGDSTAVIVGQPSAVTLGPAPSARQSATVMVSKTATTAITTTATQTPPPALEAPPVVAPDATPPAEAKQQDEPSLANEQGEPVAENDTEEAAGPGRQGADGRPENK